MMIQLKKRILRLIDTGGIKEDGEKMLYILNNKRFNPYCIRHSAITSDSDYLPEYALKKKVRWSMNSRQGSRYIKTRMGNELKNKILEYNGIISENEDCFSIKHNLQMDLLYKRLILKRNSHCIF